MIGRQAAPGAMYRVVLPQRGASAKSARSRLGFPRPATIATAFVLLAYMPAAGRVQDAMSTAASASRILELLFLAAATVTAIVMRGQGNGRPASPGAFCLIAVVTAFALWAMLTSLKGPMPFTGLAKALELIVICFIACQIACHKSVTATPERRMDLVLAGILAVVAILLAANAITQGTPLPMSDEAVWPLTDVRPRLVLGANDPLTSALLLAFSIIFTLHASASWTLKLPLLAGLGALFYVCDARGLQAGCGIGVVLSLFMILPRSPFRLLFALCVVAGVVFLAACVLLAGNLDQLILHFVGSDAFTLNSRIGLWQYILARVPDNPLLGVGYYATRFYILDAFPFAGHAHNSALEVLFSTGLIGASLFVLFLCIWIFALIKTGDRLLIGVTPIALSEGSLDPILFMPGIGMFLMLLVLLHALSTTPAPVIRRPPARYRNPGWR